MAAFGKALLALEKDFLMRAAGPASVVPGEGDRVGAKCLPPTRLKLPCTKVVKALDGEGRRALFSSCHELRRVVLGAAPVVRLSHKVCATAPAGLRSDASLLSSSPL